MQNTVRTTIRIRKDLLDQSRLLALSKGTSLQNIINETLAHGYKHITDLNASKKAMREIDGFRQKMKGRNIDINKLLAISKKDLK